MVSLSPFLSWSQLGIGAPGLCYFEIVGDQRTQVCQRWSKAESKTAAIPFRLGTLLTSDIHKSPYQMPTFWVRIHELLFLEGWMPHSGNSPTSYMWSRSQTLPLPSLISSYACLWVCLLITDNLPITSFTVLLTLVSLHYCQAHFFCFDSLNCWTKVYILYRLKRYIILALPL